MAQQNSGRVTRSMSRQSQHVATEANPVPNTEDLADTTLPGLPGSMPPNQPAINQPQPRRPIRVPQPAISSSIAPPPPPREDSPDEVEELTRVMYDQGADLTSQEHPQPPITFGDSAGNITDQTIGGGILTPREHNPIQTIAVALRTGLNILKQNTIREVQQVNQIATTNQKLIQDQQGKLKELTEETAKAIINSYVAAERTKGVETHTSNIIGKLEGLEATIKELNSTLQTQASTTKETNGHLGGIDETLTALEQRVTDLANSLDKQPAVEERTTRETRRREPRVTVPGSPSRSRSPSIDPQPFVGRSFQRESTAQPTVPLTRRTRGEPEGPSFLNQTTAMGTSVPKEARTKKPDPFNGKKGKEAENFIMKMEIYFDDYEEGIFDDKKKITNVLMNMQNGDAGNWAQPFLCKLSLKEEHSILQSWANFKKAFLADFSDPVKKEKAIRDLNRLTQTKSAQSYVTQFRTLMQEVDWNDEALIDKFREGLKPEVRKELTRITMLMEDHQTVTLEGIFQAACKFDDMIFTNQRFNSTGPGLGSSNWNQQRGGPSGNKGTNNSQRNKQTTIVRIPKEEKDRRRKEQLCIKCGKKGHMMKDCRGQWTYDKGKIQGKAGTERNTDTQDPESESEN
ncbi:Retrotransposon gag protein [Ceratobasidium sp. AG-Ba]|nr:Retrotransposon gag protein [Ceratobasidium sp. AG-Ba]